MATGKFNQVLTFYEVETIQTATGKKTIVVDGDVSLKVRARYKSLKDDYRYNNDIPTTKEIHSFTVRSKVAEKIRQTQRLSWRDKVYQVDKVGYNPSYPLLATIFVSGSSRRERRGN